MIKADLAKKFVEQVTQYTDYNINIMDERGYIIASRDVKRIGTFHDVAYCIMSGKEDMVVTFGENDYPGVKPGINVVLNMDGKRVGVVGITGNPEEVRPIAQITKMAIEAMLKYERQQEELLKRRNRKERFMSLLTHEEYPDATALRNVAKQLDYSEEIIRIPVLCVLSSSLTEPFLELLKLGDMHSEQDICFVVDENRVLIFKTMPMEAEKCFFDYRTIIFEYLEKVLKWTEKQGEHCRYFVGSFQNSFTQYYFSYQHCKWLEKMLDPELVYAFFYDFSDSYLRSTIPMSEMQRVFHIYETNLEGEFKESYLEIIGILMQTNWNLAETARALFMHKNTLLYHYNKIKDKLNVNPIVSSADRNFLEAFYYYLKIKH